MRFLLTSLALGATLLTLAAADPQPPKKKPLVKKKTSTARKRTYVRTPPVTPQMREAAHQEINDRLDARPESVIENAAALIPFFEQLRRTERHEFDQPLRILHFGDSHTAADEWTGAMRQAFQTKFGDGGGGYSLAGRPFASYRRIDQRRGNSNGWITQGLLSPNGDGIYGLGGVSIATSRPGQSVFLEAEAKRVELFYWRQPGGGPLTFATDGSPVETISTDGPEGPGYFQYTSAALGDGFGPRRFELTTLERAPVRLFGWVTEKERGVTYEPLGINGAQANLMLGWDQRLLAEHLGRRSPAMIVLAYGTNESGQKDWTYESYKQAFTTVIRTLRNAAPAATILVVGPPDRMTYSRYTLIPYPRLEMITQAQRDAALENQCAFWDLRERMGGAGAMRRWVTAGAAQGDYVHFTAPGYRLIGVTLFNDLMEQYAGFLRVRDKVFAAENGKTAEGSHSHSRDRQEKPQP